MEKLKGVVHGFGVGRSLVVVVPASVLNELNIGRGSCFSVKVDEQDRIIYELLEGR